VSFQTFIYWVVIILNIKRFRIWRRRRRRYAFLGDAVTKGRVW
jgi:hypothetical protein